MIFEDAHAIFMTKHLASRTGERRGRLERGHSHAEVLFLQNVWWPLRGNLDNVHPEYEVNDWRGRSYFADFAWLPGSIKLIFEIKGYSTHVRDMDRQRYCNELNRETFLFAMGYQVISFAYDDVAQHPDLCITLLRMVLSRYQPLQPPVSRVFFMEKEIIKLAIHLARPIRPIDVIRHFEINHKTAIRILHNLCKKGWLTPSYSGHQERIVRYELARNVVDYL